MRLLEIADKICKNNYDLGAWFRLEHLPLGRVNQTFKVTAGTGDFVLQRLHPVFGPGPAVVQNVDSVAKSLAKAGYTSSQVVPAMSGQPWVEAEGIWRLMTWLPGRTITERGMTIGMEAAQTLALFHQALVRYPPDLHVLPPAGYNRVVRSSALDWEDIIDRFEADPKMPQVIDALNLGQTLADQSLSCRASTRAVVHGDPKLENIIFSEADQAVGLIDLDTVREGHLVWDLADGLRSWAAEHGDNGRIIWNKDIYQAAVDSYRRHGPGLTLEELNALPWFVRAITLNLARRYLEDYFLEAYFTWDQARYSSLAEQNRQRGLALIDLAGTMAT
ncbi:MAG: phosphotransferase [Deltaproteobacteria bacterium]|nr:phosphotransferase [Deltaproteobacteria bacterium]